MTDLHCACLIHGDLYDWIYVDRLYNMLVRNLTKNVILHVFTEEMRPVPKPYVKHSLVDWNIGGAKQAWWYKLQIFDNLQYSGDLLYFDLDTVIVNNIDWITQLDSKNFWAVRDFKYLWRSSSYSINSSVMWFNTEKYNWVYNQLGNNINKIRASYRGDQDYLNDAIPLDQQRLFDIDLIKSWRWQCLDGGYDFSKKCHKNPGTGTLTNNASILVFHGKPKPNSVDDVTIVNYWQ